MPQATFNLKEPKSSEPTLVYLMYRFKNTKLKYSTSEKIDPKFWNPVKQRAKELRSFPEYAQFNFALDKLETTVNNCYRKLMIDDISPTPEKLRSFIDETLNKKDKVDFISFAEAVLKASDRKPVTKKAINQTIEKLKKFKKLKNQIIDFERIDLEFYNEFIDFLTVKENLKQSTVGSHIKNVKVFMREAVERGLTKNIHYQSKKFRKPAEESESIYLTEQEIKTLQDLDLADNPRLDRVRDLFVIACYTGLRFSDLTQLTLESINNQKKVIKVKTQKTGELVLIPVNSTVSRIFDKYNGHLPTLISNNKMNLYLKEIGEIGKFNEIIERVSTKGGVRKREVFVKHKMISVHTARRSFATNAYLCNVPSISIMKITGHKTEKNFLKYIKISQEDNANKLIDHPFFI